MSLPSSYRLAFSVLSSTWPVTVTIGDSRTYGNTDPTHAWPVYLQALAGTAFFNASANGRTVNDCVLAYNAEVTPNMPFLPTYAVLATLFIGSNDIPQATTAQQIYDGQTTICQTLKNQQFYTVNFTLVPETALAPGSPGEIKRLAVNALILANSAGFGSVFDIAALLPDPTDTLYYTGSGHFTPPGNQVIANALYAQLKADFHWA